jgi:ParB-like chromosome segregation protein Spo0J
MTNRIKLEMLAVDQLKPNPWNTNIVSPENQAKLEASISRLGVFKPIVVREMHDGSLQIIGGQHRWEAAQTLGHTEVPVVNLGRISEKKAKEIGLVDNGRYGADDTLQLAGLLEGLGLAADELASFMPYSESDFASIFSSVNISLDDLDLPDDAELPATPTAKPPQTHQIMRFKVPLDDVGTITDMIERTMKEQRFTDEDSLSNAGNALVHLLLGEDKR